MKIKKKNETTTHQQLPLSQETPKPPFRLQGLTDLFGEAGRPGSICMPHFSMGIPTVFPLEKSWPYC